MNPATKQCQNCKTQFAIEPEDFNFYEKVKVPPPTFCPDCRMQRRMTYRQERALYKRKCDLCGKDMIAIYSETAPFPVYCLSCWWGDGWDPQNYSREVDFSKQFFKQFKELQDQVPRPQTANFAEARLINSPYTNCVGDLKNCYLIFGALKDEDCLYSHYINHSRDCVDNLYCFKSERCYECFDIDQCYNVLFSQSSIQCRDAMFLFDCRGCTDCLGCVGLRNKSYNILNRQYSKEEYFKEKEKLGLHSREGLTAFKEKFLREIYFSLPRKFYHGQMNKNFSGDYVSESENAQNAFYARNTRNVKNVFWINNAKDVYDYVSWGDVELMYECVSMGWSSYGCKFSYHSWSSDRELEYCAACFSSANLFGCIGLRNKQYCILNKQYSESDYLKLRAEIINAMNNNPYKDARGIEYRYGEFFPIELSPYFYNETIAQEYFPLTEAEAKNNGYPWILSRERDYKITKRTEELPATIMQVSEAILEDIVGCLHAGKCAEQCTTAFRITPQELQFYKKMNIPVPLFCPNCRHAGRAKYRNPLKLWQRKCLCAGTKSENEAYSNQGTHFHGDTPCPNEFETSYSPERPEIVYCEQCYQAEVV